MPVCDLCENVQPAGDACDVCGRPFPPDQRVESRVETLPDLEPTVAPPVEATTSPIEGLEPNAAPAVRVEASLVEGLETTRVDPVEIVAAAMDGLLPTVAEGLPDDGPAEEPALAACRYCRTAPFPGEAFCSHCGMRLPTMVAEGAQALDVVLCRDCGTPVRGASCPACGVTVER